jgi:hypothetical protein
VFASVLVALDASATTVTSFAPFTATPTDGVWYESDIRGGGTASIVNLGGAGGNLQNNLPLGIGAALLTTGSSNGDKAQVAVTDAYGNARNAMTDLTLSLDYSFYKSSAGDLNAYAAPAIKLTLSNPSAVGDGHGTLTYEYYWQTYPGSLDTAPTDEWTSASITATSGLFWWDSGFGHPNSAGGPPLRTLSEWSAVFDSDFDDAEIVALSVGVGTYNQGQTGYVDDISLSYTGYSASYNFEPIPEASTGLLLVLGLAGLGFQGRRRH